MLPQIGLAEHNPDGARTAFSKLQSLIGEWHGKLPDGDPIEITYEQINGGAIVERYRSRDPMWWNMSTVYHRDKDKIVMSHYCSWGNHPRMEKVMQTGRAERIDFELIDLAENQPENGYMRNFVIVFVDRDHLVHRWTWRENGTDTPLKLTLSRAK